MPVITNVEDLRAIARRRCPRVMFDYVDSGSYDEVTRDANRDELRSIRFRQRVLVDTTGRTMEAELLGTRLALPVAIAPTGLTGLVYGDGEILAARAAEAEGTVYTLSTMSICTIEDVRAATKKPFWFQLYVFRDRGFSEEIIARARAAECPVLFVTVDLPQRGQRHCDIKNGLTVPPRFSLRIALGIANWSQTHFDQSLNWRDIDWIRKLWPGKLVLKGILDVDDARTAVAAGVDGIVVSNHGGRQLDGAPASIHVLPEIAGAVGDRLEVLFDGGIRSGQDVIKALALGARGCLIGRAHLYGLAAMGEAGVRKAVDIIRQEMDITMMLTGLRDLRKVPREVLYDGDARA